MFHPEVQGSAGEKVISAEEATCFYHPQKRASVPCDTCGRFLCALCDVDFNGEHICPNCLQAGKKKGKLKHLDNERVLYDRIALATAILPIITVFATIITAPLAVYLAIRHWNTPVSVVPRWTRLRFVCAIILGLAQITIWVGVFVYNFHTR
jgi:hypothetical protein